MNTTYALALFVTGWGLTAAITPYFIRLGRRLSVVDAPGDRKVHDTPVPRTGGMAIFAAISLIVACGILLVPRLRRAFMRDPGFYLSVAAAATMVFGVGALDDYRGASVVTRLGVESTAAALVIFLGGVKIQSLGIPFVGTVDIGWWAYPLTAFWIVGVTNALNIIDGLDGLAGGIAFIACFGVFAIAFLNEEFMAMASLALLAGACLGFLRYNSHPARVFLGDSGSLLLGFLLACISVVTSLKRSTSLALILPMQMLAVPLIDTLYAMGRRMVGHATRSDEVSIESLKAMFRADREHIHHILLDVGFSHPKAVWVLYGLSTVIAVFGFFSALTLDDRASLLFLLVGLAGFLLIRHYGSSLPFIRRWKTVKKNEDLPPESDSGLIEEDKAAE